MVVQLGQRNRACIARFLLCVGRLERRGDVLAMDPALMEEMLQYMFKVHAHTHARALSLCLWMCVFLLLL